MPPIKLAIADDHVLFLKGLKLLIKSFLNVQLVIEVKNGYDLMDAIAQQQPDVILLDYKMPAMDGAEAIRRIRQLYPDIKIIILTMYDDPNLINQMVDAGANGYLLKDTDPEIVEEAIKTVVKTDFYFTEMVEKALLHINQPSNESRKHSPSEFKDLTDREREILTLICEEKTSQEIADELGISKRTVEWHRKNLIEKVGVKSTAGLVIKAIKHDIFKL